MNRKISVSVALTITLIAITVTFAITWIISSESFNKAVSSVTQRQAQYSKLAEIDNYVRHNFFGEIDDMTLNDRIAQGYLNGIGDRYSTYYSEKEYGELQEYESGERVDIGLEVVRDADGYFRIVRVFDESPAARAGVEAGGRITFVDDVDAKTVQTVRAMQSLLRGMQGTTVKITGLYGAAEERVFEVQRSNYAPPTVEYAQWGDFGYFRIYSFGANTYTDFDYLLNQALLEDLKGLVFDLRANPGGQFQQAYNMINALCPRGTVAKSEAKNGTTKVLATSDDEAVDLPMVVLVNENTAAAAELFAVSIRDLSGGRIAGVTTMGKGSLQSAPQQLTDGSALSITTAMLLTGRDESFDTVGVIPDVEVLMQTDDEGKLYQVNPREDDQARRAMELVRSMAGEGELPTGEDAGETAVVVAPAQSGGEDESTSGTTSNASDASAASAEDSSAPEASMVEAESGSSSAGSSSSSSGAGNG